MPFSLFQAFVESIATGVFRGENASNFVQSVFGLPANLSLDAARLATKLSWTKSSEQPNDALELVGKERILNAMPDETAQSYRERLAAAWDIWPKAGNPATINDVLADGGYVGLIVIERQTWPTKTPVGYWSLFWLLDTLNSIPAQPAFTYGSGAKYGTQISPGVFPFYGMTGPENIPEIISSICFAVRKLRPAHVILDSIIIPGTAPIYGFPGLTYGSGATYGGTPSVVIDCS